MPSSRTTSRRSEILHVAADLATSEGLEGLSIGALAKTVEMSKSGLFAHFGSKEELQHATIDQAAAAFDAAIFVPAAAAPTGRRRLERLLDLWVAHIEHSAYRGGCFFDAASTEFGSRPGPVRDRLAILCRRWISALEDEAKVAVRAGEFAPDTDVPGLVFRLHAFVEEANWWRELFDEPAAFDRARSAIVDTLASRAPAPLAPNGASPERKDLE